MNRTPNYIVLSSKIAPAAVSFSGGCLRNICDALLFATLILESVYLYSF